MQRAVVNDLTEEQISLDVEVEKDGGSAAQVGRWLQEGRAPSAEEAELVATICAAVVSYLAKMPTIGAGEEHHG